MNFTHIASLFLSTSLLAQGITVLDGPSLSNLDVRVLEESQLASASGTMLLAAIDVLPIEITCRRASQELDGTVARVETRQGIPRVELPGIGRLLAYRRQGGALWGYLLVPSIGNPRVLVELPGTSTTSPFADRIGVGADGVHAVIPQRFGQTMHVLRLDGGTFPNGQTARTVALPGSDVTALTVGATAAFTTLNDRLYRFALATGGAANLTPPIPLGGARLKPELAMSGDGSKVVFLYGPTNETLELWQLDGTAAAPARLNAPAAKYEEPAYLPEGPGHARLMQNHDGSRVFCMTSGNGGTGDESYLVDATGVLPRLHVTGDQTFEPYIGIHILPSFKANALLVAIGDADQMDWYKAELSVTGGTVANLTGTGSMLQPYPSGTLVPGDLKVVGTAAFATDVDPIAQTQTLRRLDVNAASSQVLFQDLGTDLAIGGALGAAPDLFVGGDADRLYSSATGALIGATPLGIHATPPVSTPFFGVTTVVVPPNLRLVTFYSAVGGLFFGPWVQDLQQMVLTPGGGLLLNAGGSLQYLSLGNPHLGVPMAHRGVRVFLSGASD